MGPTRNGVDDDASLLHVAQSHISRFRAELERFAEERKRIDTEAAIVQERVTALDALIASLGSAQHVIAGFERPETEAAASKRRSTMEMRRSEFEGMTLPEAILAVLSPDQDMHVDELVAKIFDIDDKEERQRVKNNVVSTLVRGASDGRWLKKGGNRFQAAAKEREQSALTESALAPA